MHWGSPGCQQRGLLQSSGCVWHQQDLRDSFKFERFLAVSRVYTDPATSVASHAEETTVGNGQKKKRKQKKVSTSIYAGF